MESGRVSGLASRQDGTQFEDALRRLYALEKKLTDQVQIDIRELRSKWILPRVERVTTNTFKLYQVREQLKLSKVLYLEEERILEEFTKVKQGLKTCSMDDDTFEATKDTCMFLGGKLMDIRSKQLRCYSDNEDLETTINKDIMTLRFEDKDFEDLDINQVRACTPLRQLSPTPLDRHKSREPSPFIMPNLRLGSGTITPGGSTPADTHTYLSRPGSSQSLYGGGGIGGSHMGLDTFRAAMEAKQAEDESLPKDRRQSINHPPTLSQSMCNINLKGVSSINLKSDGTDLLTPGSMFSAERPSSAMSEMSINMHDEYTSRAESRMEHFGDDLSEDGIALSHGSEFSYRRNASDYLQKCNKERNEVMTPKTFPENQIDKIEPKIYTEKIKTGNETQHQIEAGGKELMGKIGTEEMGHGSSLDQGRNDLIHVSQPNQTIDKQYLLESAQEEVIDGKRNFYSPGAELKSKSKMEKIEGKDTKQVNKEPANKLEQKISPVSKHQCKSQTLDSSIENQENKETFVKANELKTEMSGLNTNKQEMEEELKTSTLKTEQKYAKTLELKQKEDKSATTDLQAKDTKQPTLKSKASDTAEIVSKIGEKDKTTTNLQARDTESEFDEEDSKANKDHNITVNKTKAEKPRLMASKTEDTPASTLAATVKEQEISTTAIEDSQTSTLMSKEKEHKPIAQKHNEEEKEVIIKSDEMEPIAFILQTEEAKLSTPTMKVEVKDLTTATAAKESSATPKKTKLEHSEIEELTSMEGQCDSSRNKQKEKCSKNDEVLKEIGTEDPIKSGSDVIYQTQKTIENNAQQPLYDSKDSEITNTKDILSNISTLKGRTQFQESGVNQIGEHRSLPETESNNSPDEIEIIDTKSQSNTEKPRLLGRERKSKQPENIEVVPIEEVIIQNTNQSETVELLDINRDEVGKNDENEARKKNKEVGVNKDPSIMPHMSVNAEKDQAETPQSVSDIKDTQRYGSDNKEIQNNKLSNITEKMPKEESECEVIEQHSIVEYASDRRLNSQLSKNDNNEQPRPSSSSMEQCQAELNYDIMHETVADEIIPEVSRVKGKKDATTVEDQNKKSNDGKSTPETFIKQETVQQIDIKSEAGPIIESDTIYADNLPSKVGTSITDISGQENLQKSSSESNIQTQLERREIDQFIDTRVESRRKTNDLVENDESEIKHRVSDADNVSEQSAQVETKAENRIDTAQPETQSDHVYIIETQRPSSKIEQQILFGQTEGSHPDENTDQEVLIDEEDLELHEIQRSRTPRSRPVSRQDSQEKTRRPEREIFDERPDSRGSMSGFTQTEPAEWYQQDDNEDELMIILDTEQTVLEEEEPEDNPLGFLNSRPESRERLSSNNSQGSSSNLMHNNVNISANSEDKEIPTSISKNIEVLREMDKEMELDIETKEDLEALMELELQYEKENGKDSRSSDLGRTSMISNHSNEERGDPAKSPNTSRDVSNVRTENIESKEVRNSRPGSRSSLKSSNKRNSFAEKKKISFDDDIDVKDLSATTMNITLQGNDFPQSEPADWYPSDENEFENEDELFIVLDSDNKITNEGLALNRNRSQSKERPSSRSSRSSNISLKDQPEKDRKKSSSMVPELEVVEIPDALGQKFKDMGGDVEFLKDAYTSFNKIDRVDSPRPSSRPSRPSSTGFIHLDEFEKKLAAMESELAIEEIRQKEIDNTDTEERSLSRGENMWDLSSNIEKASEFEQRTLDSEKGSEYQRETKFGSVRKTNNAEENLTDDGFYINQEEELHTVDHSMIKEGEFTAQTETLGSGCVSPGQSDTKSKKVSFAASDERYEIERPGEVNTLGKKLFSFSPPKPMKKLPGKESHTEEATNISQELQSIEAPILVTKKSFSKETSPMLRDNNSSTKGMLKSLTGSPDPDRKESGSLFGSLLRKGRKGSRSGSRQSSVERSSQDLGSEEEGRASIRESDVDSDVGSENSLVMKFKKLTKRKQPKVQTADFDELFARGMAKSAQLESENSKDPFATSFTEHTDGTVFTPFELYSKDKEFEKTQKQEGIGYAEKVLSFLDDQAHTSQITDDIIDDQVALPSKGNREFDRNNEEKKSSNKKKNINVVCDGGNKEHIITADKVKLSPKASKDSISPSKDLVKSPEDESPMLGQKSSSMKNLISSITGGRIGSKSPDPHRGDSGSLFGSLLRKGRKGSRSGSRQSSVERERQDITSEDGRRSASGTSDLGSDAVSENSIALKLKNLTKRKIPKVKTTDFDELFARGEAKSAQLDSENNKDPFQTNIKEASFTNKVQSFLGTQAHPPQIIKDIVDEAEQFTREKKSHGQLKIKEGDQVVDSDINKYIKTEQSTDHDDVKLSAIQPKKDILSAKGFSKSPEEEFLAKITEFVAKYEVEEEPKMLSQKSSSIRNLHSSITGGEIGSKSPDPQRGEIGSLFGSLLRKGKKGSRSGSRQSSVDRESQDLISEVERRSVSRISDLGSDAGSENSLALKLKKITKRRTPKVKTTDFDELFAKGEAKSAQLDSENNKDPFKTNKEEAKLPGKVLSLPDNQAHPSKIVKDTAGEAEEITRKKTHVEQKIKEGGQVLDSNITKKIRNEGEKTNQYTDTDIIKGFATQKIKDMFMSKDLPNSPEEEFLAKITQFVAKYEADAEYTQPVWPAVPSKDKMPTLREPKKCSANITEDSLRTNSSREMFERFTEKETETKSREVRSKSKSTEDPKVSIFKEQNQLLKTNLKSPNKAYVSYSQGNQDRVSTAREEKVRDNNVEEATNTMSEDDFLAQVTSFVAKYEPADEYAQKIWPAIPQEQTIENESKSGGKKAPRLTKTPGKTYLDIESGTEWFGTSIEMENKDHEDIKENVLKSSEKSKRSENNLSAGAALMRKHISATELEKSTTPQKEDKLEDKNSEGQGKSAMKIIISPPNSKRTKSHSFEPTKKESDSQKPQVSPVDMLKKTSPSTDEPVNSLQLSNETQISTCSMRKDEPIEQSGISSLVPVKIPSPAVALGTEETMHQLQPQKQSANEDFYSKLVSGLRNITTPEPEHAKEVADQDIYRKYSHHLGRAEFGTLRKKDSTQSSTSNLKYQSRDSVYNLPSRGLSRDPSFDKINVKLACNRKVSQQDSGDRMRSQSKVSDTSEALPDLELEDDLPPVLFSNRDANISMHGTHSKREQSEIGEEIKPSAEVLNKKEEALKDVSDNKQKIKEVKEQIQNGLMSVVGFGVMAYLTTLETMGGGQ